MEAAVLGFTVGAASAATGKKVVGITPALSEKSSGADRDRTHSKQPALKNDWIQMNRSVVADAG
ncbi:MAG: hypothetical protein QGG46_06810 [Gammaproteobacteria bacterium]|jgi:hypothetical protein|nr:hypothetical protein [Gammaproteobacteria bacterium]